ncbi:hypothetical protein BMS3Bbin04_01174 [bacterium BMS3Bbin04]|nr:hypothetical protein BMS3Bbin04_01174 [bacterium BMS3Bbin04]
MTTISSSGTSYEQAKPPAEIYKNDTISIQNDTISGQNDTISGQNDISSLIMRHV